MKKKRFRRKLSKKIAKKAKGKGPKIGDVIKVHRIKKKFTQHKIAEGMNCYSYYSKVENNVLKPSKAFIKELSKRLNVDLEEVQTAIEEDSVLHGIIEGLFYRDIDTLQDAQKKAKAMNHEPSRQMIALARDIVREKHDAASVYIKTLLPLCDSMGPANAILTLIIVATVLHEENHHRAAYDIVLNIDDVPHVDPMLDALRHEICFHVKQSLRLYNDANEHYVKARSGFMAIPNPQRSKKLELKRIEALTTENVVSASEQFEHLKKGYRMFFEKNEIVYYQALLSVHRGEGVTKEHYEALDATHVNSWYQKTVALLDFEGLHPEDVRSIRDMIDTEGLFDPLQSAKVRFKFLKEEQMKDFLKNVLIPLAIRNESADDVEFYSHSLMNLLKKRSRYKEAMAVQDNLIDFLKEEETEDNK